MSPFAGVGRRSMNPGGTPMSVVRPAEYEPLFSRQQQLLDQLAHVAKSREVTTTVPELAADALRMLQILKRAGEEIERLRAVSENPVDLEVVRSDLRQVAEAVSRLELRVAASRRIAAEARELAVGIHELISDRSISPVRLLDLAKRISDVERAGDGGLFLAGIDELAAWECADIDGGGIDPSVLAQGILSAHLSASLGPAVGNVVRSSKDRTLVLAALLQDAGLVCLQSRRADRPEPIRGGDERSRRLHPWWSAALVQGIRHCGQECPRLVAEHHENLIGSGFPGGRRDRQLTPRSRFLAVVACFVEDVRLVLQPSIEGGGDALRVENAVESGCRTLSERVRFGERDPRITAAFVERVRVLNEDHRTRFASAEKTGDAVPQTGDAVPPVRSSLVEPIPQPMVDEESVASSGIGHRPSEGGPPRPKFLRKFNRSSINVLFSQQDSAGVLKLSVGKSPSSTRQSGDS